MTARILFALVLLSGTALAQSYPSPTYQGLTLQADPAAANQAVRKGYLDQRLNAALPNLSSCLLLGGAGAAGVAQGVALGAGLACSANTLAAAIGTVAGTVAAGNDSRIVGAVQAAGGNASATTVTAAGATAARSFAAMAADTIKVLNFGAACDGVTDDTAAVQAAFAAAAQVPNGAVLEVPQRSCLITGAINQAIGAKRSIHLKGASGMSGFVSSNGSGIVITLTDGTAGFDASDVAFLRSGSGQAGIGLSVQATVTQAQTISHFRNLLFSGSGASWQEGLRLVSLSAPVVEGMRSYMPDGTGSGSGYGLHITGSDTSHFLTDAKVTNSLLQGGFATIKVDGAVQGVYVANTEGIGADYGIHAADATGSYLMELLTVTNSHWNNALAGIYLQNYNENQISNNLFLHFSPLAGRAYQAVFADHSGYMTMSGNTFLGGGVGAENLFKATSSQLYTVTGNNAVTLAGLCIDTSSAWNVVITGNSCQGVTDPGIVVGATSMVSGNVVNGRNELVGPGSGVALVKGSQAVTSGFLSLSASVNLVGAGSGQSDAAAITANQVFVSSVPAGSGVKLPLTTTLAGGSATTVEVWNNGANPVLFYPSSGETIVGNAANAPISVPSGGQERCWWPGLGTAWVCSGATNLVPLATLASPTFTGTVTIPAGAVIAGYAPLASPGLSGVPTAPTAAADTNTTQLATTAFTLGQAASTVPAAPGTAAVGTSTRFARADHVHPTDTTRAPVASPTFTGTVTIPAGAAISGYAPVASPSFTGTVTIPAGASISGYAPLASPTFTGTVTIPAGAAISGYAPLASPSFTGTVTIPAGALIGGYAPLASPTFSGTVTIPSGASISGYAPLAAPALTGTTTMTGSSTGTTDFQLALRNSNSSTGMAGVSFNSAGETTNPKAGFGQVRSGSNGWGPLVWYNSNDTTTAAYAATDERMRLTPAGTLMVGTTTDNGAKLQVAGSITANGATVATLASPALTGTPTAPTAAVGTSTTQLATTAFVAAALPQPTSPSFQIMSASGTFVPAAGSTWVRFRLFGPGGNGGAGIACASGASCSGGGGGGAGGMTDFWVPAARVQSGGCTITVGVAGSSNTVVTCNTGLLKTAYRGGAGAAGATSTAAGGGGGGGDMGQGGAGSGASTGSSNTFPNTGNSAFPLTVSAGAASSAAGTCSRGGDNNYGPTGGGSGSGLNAGAAQGTTNCGGGENPMSSNQAPIITDTGCEPNVGGASGVASTSAAATAGGAGGLPGGGGGGGGSGTVSGGAGGAGSVGRVCIWQG